MKIYNSNKGVSLYLALMIMGILLAIALGISAIFIGQTKMLKEMGDSVIAFYAADTGIEEVLSGDRNNPSSGGCIESSPCSLDNGAEYYLDIRDNTADPNCPNFCIKSTGSYKETKRAIEITY